jgi:hypothetical protein
LLQPAKKLQQGPPPAPSSGAATRGDEKPVTKPSEKRISTMSEPQIMEKLRSVVSPKDPSTIYAKIKKVGQGWVEGTSGSGSMVTILMFFSCLSRASGSVYVAKTLATGVRVAIKQMDLAQQPRKELIVNEIIVMGESRHPNIVNYLESFLIRSSDLWVVMEYMEGGAQQDGRRTNCCDLSRGEWRMSDSRWGQIIKARAVIDLSRSTTLARPVDHPSRH